MKSATFDALAGNAALEIEQFAAFDHGTRRFIAYSMYFVPGLVPPLAKQELSGNPIVPFLVSDKERAERLAAYAPILRLRGCTAKGEEGRKERRAMFGDLLGMARLDMRWKRLSAFPAFYFCYERLVGPTWRELLPLCWQQAILQRKVKGPAVQLPLDSSLFSDSAIPSHLENDDPPCFFPTMEDADRMDIPLFGSL